MEPIEALENSSPLASPLNYIGRMVVGSSSFSVTVFPFLRRSSSFLPIYSVHALDIISNLLDVRCEYVDHSKGTVRIY